MSKWVDLKTPPGAPEIKKMLEPTPIGPFALVPQSSYKEFEKDPFNFKSLIKVDKFELRWGHITYAVGQDFKPLECGYWVDCSD